MLIKQPVKEAVREALEEDRIESGGRSKDATVREDASDRTRESSEKSRGSSSLRRLLLLAAIAGAAYYAKQRRGMDLEDSLGEEVGLGDTGGGVETSAEDPLSSDSERRGDTSMGDESDEGTTTRQ